MNSIRPPENETLGTTISGSFFRAQHLTTKNSPDKNPSSPGRKCSNSGRSIYASWWLQPV